MNIIDTVIAKATEEFKVIGFIKKKKGIYVYEVTEGFLGWIGLNHVKRDNSLEINPVIGVRSQAVEKMLANLLDEKYHPYIPPTISISLGYLMPENCYRGWLFNDDNDTSGLSDLALAINTYAIPFIIASASLKCLDQQLTLLGSRCTHVESAMYRLPLVKFLLNDKQNALSVCHHYLANMGNRTDLAAERYRKFANALKGYIEE